VKKDESQLPQSEIYKFKCLDQEIPEGRFRGQAGDGLKINPLQDVLQQELSVQG